MKAIIWICSSSLLFDHPTSRVQRSGHTWKELPVVAMVFWLEVEKKEWIRFKKRKEIIIKNECFFSEYFSIFKNIHSFPICFRKMSVLDIPDLPRKRTGFAPIKNTIHVSMLPYTYTNNDVAKLFEVYGRLAKYVSTHHLFYKSLICYLLSFPSFYTIFSKFLFLSII